MDETSVRQGMSPTAKAAVHRHTEAAVFFRTCLHQDQIRTHIRDPETGEILDLDPLDWLSVSTNNFSPLRLPDHVGDFAPNDDPAVQNPNTFIRGAYRPVFVWRAEF
jgi:hypothetical protein